MPKPFHRVGHGPHAVLVLHGWFGDARSFEPIEAWLSQDKFSYVFVDYRGYGERRDTRGAYTIDEIAADALALADALGFRAFSLVGHSMGGMAIEKIAACAPERVRALVPVAPVPCGGIAFDAATRAVRRRRRASGQPAGHHRSQHRRPIAVVVGRMESGVFGSAFVAGSVRRLLSRMGRYGLQRRDRRAAPGEGAGRRA
ncbi:alpha/beta fold hydrolase [Burkholderia ubonensis]|uniref:alpha/beta fold hydrolase n=1 Tax=Burkholderia ubonensis TaxID=101571 RepID=UPI0039F589E6